MDTQFFISGYRNGRNLISGAKKVHLAVLALILLLMIAGIVNYFRVIKAPLPQVKRDAFDQKVLSVQDGEIPYGFPSDLPMERQVPGYELKQSTANLDYLSKISSYVVAFRTPWNLDEAVDHYKKYLKSHGYTEQVRNESVSDTVKMLQGFAKDGSAISVQVLQYPVPEGLPADVRVSISYREGLTQQPSK